MFEGLFLIGCFIGFCIAMPVGPIGMICIRHTFMRGIWAGLCAGLGASLADSMYGALAGAGLSTVSDYLITYNPFFKFFSCCFLIYLGTIIFNSKASTDVKGEVKRAKGYHNIFITTFLLTLTNPMTILSFAGIFAALGIHLEKEDFISSLYLTSGVFVGSATWWLLLCSGCTFLKRKFEPQSFDLLNKLSGIALFAFGSLAGLSLFSDFFLS